MNPPQVGNSPDAVDRPMVAVISWLLITGVSCSALILAVGLVLLAVTGQTGYQGLVSPALALTRQDVSAFPRTIGGVWQGALMARPFAVIELGVLVLIATPVIRVAASIFLFFMERDYLYTVITLGVLALLLFSIFVLG